jgi:hypothetical protein
MEVAAAATGKERVVEEEVPSVGKGPGRQDSIKQQRIVALLRFCAPSSNPVPL